MQKVSIICVGKMIKKYGISATVTALAFLYRNVIRISEHRINGYLLTRNNALL